MKNIGCAKAVFVFGDGADKVAVISEICAQIRKGNRGERIFTAGPVRYDRNANHHIQEIILPLVDEVVETLCSARFHYQLSIANLSAASLTDRGFEISGYSTDIPLFLALLSAALQLPLPPDLASTGHIASPKGDIRHVHSIPEKRIAAIDDPRIERFLYPSLGCDRSLETLTPAENELIQQTLLEARDKIQCLPISDLFQAIQTVVDDESAVWGALFTGYFGKCASFPDDGRLTGSIVPYLQNGLEKRYESFLERYLFAGENDAAQRLLRARIHREIENKSYPADFGKKVLQIIAALPPATRRTKIAFPLVPLRECLQLGQWATDDEAQDVRWLITASAGDRLQRNAKQFVKDDARPVSVNECAESALELVLAEINVESLAHNVDIPIDRARLSYLMDSIEVNSTEEFYDIIAAFYLHLIRHARNILSPALPGNAGSEAYALLERAYARFGGEAAAIARAITGIEGGIRRVLDTLTDHFKQEEREKYIKRIFREVLDATRWEEKTAFMSAFLQLIAPQLPPEIQGEPPERYAHDYEAIVRLYVKSIEQVKERLRAL